MVSGPLLHSGADQDEAALGARNGTLDEQQTALGVDRHPEVLGTMGQLPEGAVVLVESVEDIGSLGLSLIALIAPLLVIIALADRKSTRLNSSH